MSNFVYCGQCGQSNPEDNKFCGKCGKPLSTVSVKNNTSESTSPNSCPKCKGTDQIRKLSSISSAEKRTTSGTSFSSGRSDIYDRDSNYVGDSHSSSTGYIAITEQSDLANKVSRPPMPPKPPEPQGNSLVANIIIGVFVFISLCLGAYAGSQLKAKGAPVLLQLGGCGGSMVVIIVVGTFIAMSLTDPSKEQKQAYQAQLKIHEQHLNKWDKACKRWEQMYYCYRDDVIFIPNESGTVSPSQTTQFCYQSIKD